MIDEKDFQTQVLPEPSPSKKKKLLTLLLLLVVIALAVHLYRSLAAEAEAVANVPSLQRQPLAPLPNNKVSYFAQSTLQQLSLKAIFLSKKQAWVVMGNDDGQEEKLRVGDRISLANLEIIKIQPSQIVLRNRQHQQLRMEI